MKKLAIVFIGVLVLVAVACAAVVQPSSSTTTAVGISPVWSNLRLIFEYGGMPAVIMLFGWLYLRAVNKQWAKLVADMQGQFREQQSLVLAALQNNTAALNVLGTKLALGCMLFRQQAELEAGITERSGGYNVKSPERPQGGAGSSSPTGSG